MPFKNWLLHKLFMFLVFGLRALEVSCEDELQCHFCKAGDDKCSSKPCHPAYLALGPVCLTVIEPEPEPGIDKVSHFCMFEALTKKLGVEIGGKCKVVTQSKWKRSLERSKPDFAKITKMAEEDLINFLASALEIPEHESRDDVQKLKGEEITTQEFMEIVGPKLEDVIRKNGISLEGGAGGQNLIKVCACNETDCNSKEEEMTLNPDEDLTDPTQFYCYVCLPGLSCSPEPCHPWDPDPICVTLAMKGNLSFVSRMCLPKSVTKFWAVEPGQCKEVKPQKSKSKDGPKPEPELKFTKPTPPNSLSPEKMKYYSRVTGMTESDLKELYGEAERGEITEEERNRIFNESVADVYENYLRTSSFLFGRNNHTKPETTSRGIVCACDKPGCNSRELDKTRPGMFSGGASNSISGFLFFSAFAIVIWYRRHPALVIQ